MSGSAFLDYGKLDVVGIFIGMDRSMGFDKGRSYELRLIRLANGNFMAIDMRLGLYCEYQSVFAFLTNWKEISALAKNG